MVNLSKLLLNKNIIPYRLKKRLRESAKYSFMLNISMLWEDINHGVMPVGGKTEIENFNVKIEPCIPELEYTIADGISGRYSSTDIKEALCEFINNCAPHFLTSKFLVYSLNFAHRVSDGLLIEFELERLDASRVLKCFKNRYYFANIKGVPPEIEMIGLSKLYKEKIAVFKIPSNLRKKIKAAKRNLEVLDSRYTPVWALNKPFYSLEILKSQALAVLEATSYLGWNGRRNANEEITEYYYWHRFLSFEKFKILLRQSILKTLNGVLETISPSTVKAPTIIIEGLPTLADVNEAGRKLRNGLNNYKEIIGPFFHY